MPPTETKETKAAETGQAKKIDMAGPSLDDALDDAFSIAPGAAAEDEVVDETGETEEEGGEDEVVETEDGDYEVGVEGYDEEEEVVETDEVVETETDEVVETGEVDYKEQYESLKGEFGDFKVQVEKGLKTLLEREQGKKEPAVDLETDDVIMDVEVPDPFGDAFDSDQKAALNNWVQAVAKQISAKELGPVRKKQEAIDAASRKQDNQNHINAFRGEIGDKGDFGFEVLQKNDLLNRGMKAWEDGNLREKLHMIRAMYRGLYTEAQEKQGQQKQATAATKKGRRKQSADVNRRAAPKGKKAPPATNKSPKKNETLDDILDDVMPQVTKRQMQER